MKNVSPYWDHIGMKEVEMSEGKSLIELIVKEEVTQRRGVVHGGVLASMIDASVGAAIRSQLPESQYAVTLEMKINYIRPASGEKLLGKGQVIHKGKSVVVGNAEILNDENKLIATGTATFMLITK